MQRDLQPGSAVIRREMASDTQHLELTYPQSIVLGSGIGKLARDSSLVKMSA